MSVLERDLLLSLLARPERTTRIRQLEADEERGLRRIPLERTMAQLLENLYRQAVDRSAEPSIEYEICVLLDAAAAAARIEPAAIVGFDDETGELLVRI